MVRAIAQMRALPDPVRELGFQASLVLAWQFINRPCAWLQLPTTKRKQTRTRVPRPVAGIFAPNRRNDLGQQQIRLRIPGEINYCTPTAGVLQLAKALDPTVEILDWSTKQAVQWDEYRTMGVMIEIIPFYAQTATSTGMTYFWLSEINLLPTVKIAQERSEAIILPNDPRCSSSKRLFLKWTPRDIDDQAFNASTSSQSLAYFNAYTDVATLLHQNNGSPDFAYRMHFDVILRGLKSV